MSHNFLPSEPQRHHLMHDRLRADATRLRNEEMARLAQCGSAFVRDAAQRAARAANRLAARLRQHAKQRAVEA